MDPAYIMEGNDKHFCCKDLCIIFSHWPVGRRCDKLW